MADPSTYTVQHAFASLLPKPADITNADRDPDSLLAMLALFRDVELDDGLADETVTREQECASFYLVDDEEEVKNAAIHLSATLTAIATNAQAGYQASPIYGVQLRASILFRASIVYRFALATQGADIVSAKRAFHNFNNTDSIFADLADAEQITNVLTARRTALMQSLQSTMQAATNELHGSTISESKLLSSILASDVFADTQDLAREVCLYLAKTFHFTFTISGEDADKSLAELCIMGGLQDSDTPFLETDTRFKIVSTIAIRLVVRSRKLFSERKVTFPSIPKAVTHLVNVYLIKHIGDPISTQAAAAIVSTALGLYSTSSSRPDDHWLFITAFFQHKQLQEPEIRRKAMTILHDGDAAATMTPANFVAALHLPAQQSLGVSPMSYGGSLRDKAIAVDGFDSALVLPQTLDDVPINHVLTHDLGIENRTQWIGARLIDSLGRIGRVASVHQPVSSLTPALGKHTNFNVIFADNEREVMTAEVINRCHISFLSAETKARLAQSGAFASPQQQAASQVPALTAFPEHHHRHSLVPNAKFIDGIAASIGCHTNANDMNAFNDNNILQHLSMHQDNCAVDYARTVYGFIDKYASSTGKELALLESARPAAYAKLETKLFNARNPLGTGVYFVRDVDMLNLFRNKFDHVKFEFFQPVMDSEAADEIFETGSSASKKGLKPPNFSNDALGYTRFESAITLAFDMLDAAKMLSTKQREGWTWLIRTIREYHIVRNVHCSPRDVYHWFKIRVRTLTRELKACIMHAVDPCDWPNLQTVSDINGDDKLAYDALQNAKQTRKLMKRVLDDCSPSASAKKPRLADDSALKTEMAALRKTVASLQKSIGKGGSPAVETNKDGKGKCKDRNKAKGKGAAPGTHGIDFKEWKASAGLDAKGAHRCFNHACDRPCAHDPCTFSHDSAAVDQDAALALRLSGE
jgi:hypothetical protein